MTLALGALAALCYAAAAALCWRAVRTTAPERALPLIAIGLHGWALGLQVFHHGAITIGTNEALSLFAWQSAVLLWAFCWKEPLRTLGIAVYPLAAIAALAVGLWPTPASDLTITDWKVRSHIVVSLLSAGLLTLAAVQAVLLAVQERLLHTHEQARLMRALPPLLTMERLLFQLVAVGFWLLSLTLVTGLWFLEDWMAQHLAHKTILSITAWLIFGVLLWGRWRHGWRGRVAIRWALSGYATLILAYFGSKVILEQILGRHWS
ncbi:MAG TPA: cytochrome c biogenesis protein CcsA [Solimonas sp.]|nr:cytochrome c biogenesis protein CcsA [Solimonas sp.]